LLVRASAYLPCFSSSLFNSSCKQACSVGCLFETWTGGSCFFPQLPYTSQEGHLRETWYPWPWLLRAPTGDNLVTNGSARIARSSSSICTNVVSSVSFRVPSLRSLVLVIFLNDSRSSTLLKVYLPFCIYHLPKRHMMCVMLKALSAYCPS
jgi:hypothetical protein